MDKKRCNNFTSTETDILVGLVEDFEDILECKKTDTVTNSMKEAEWQKMESRFNALSGTARTAKMLRSKWKKIKKEFAEHKQSLYKTGGGPGCFGDFDGITNRVLAIVGVGATGTTSRFDSDLDPSLDTPVTEAIDIPSAQESESTVSVLAIEINPSPENITTEDIYEPSCSWKNWNPQQLRQPKTKALQISGKEELLNLVEKTNTDFFYVAENKAVSMTVDDEKIVCQKDELATRTPLTLETPQCSTINKRKRVYKVEPIPTKIRSTKTRYEQLQEELVLKKMALIDLQMKVIEEEREEKRALFELQKEEAIQKTKQSAEKHELEIKVLLADLQGKIN
ncbi:unnamed protein product [Ceutorhynchus assimilis]|uniref:Regulatory protein zeste n=1 Tax=Ceutorhynchus assimilis TaxID=467358 RepID=A0A9N9MJH0_9CUCU|nr:unnamed protein product [Ceutorhynchus assimilis]